MLVPSSSQGSESHRSPLRTRHSPPRNAGKESRWCDARNTQQVIRWTLCHQETASCNWHVGAVVSNYSEAIFGPASTVTYVPVGWWPRTVLDVGPSGSSTPRTVSIATGSSSNVTCINNYSRLVTSPPRARFCGFQKPCTWRTGHESITTQLFIPSEKSGERERV